MDLRATGASSNEREGPGQGRAPSCCRLVSPLLPGSRSLCHQGDKRSERRAEKGLAAEEALPPPDRAGSNFVAALFGGSSLPAPYSISHAKAKLLAHGPGLSSDLTGDVQRRRPPAPPPSHTFEIVPLCQGSTMSAPDAAATELQQPWTWDVEIVDKNIFVSREVRALVRRYSRLSNYHRLRDHSCSGAPQERKDPRGDEVMECDCRYHPRAVSGLAQTGGEGQPPGL